MSSCKRQSSPSYPSAKRQHTWRDETCMLAELPDSIELFRDELAAQRARVKGLLKNWNGEEEYALLEERIMNIVKEQEDEVLSEELLMAVLPELKSLESTTLSGILAQYSRHMRYEEAAAKLVEQAVTAVEDRMANQQARQQAMADAKLEQVQLVSRSRLEQANAEAEEEAGSLHGHIETLREQLDKANAKIKEQERELEKGQQQLEEALTETDLKRQASKKLKEEVIENDRLTVATLNRIKALEAALDDAKEEIERLQDEKERSVSEQRYARDREEENHALKDALQDREELVLNLSQQLDDAKAAQARAEAAKNTLVGSGGSRRDSFLDRFGKAFESPFGLGSSLGSPSAGARLD